MFPTLYYIMSSSPQENVRYLLNTLLHSIFLRQQKLIYYWKLFSICNNSWVEAIAKNSDVFYLLIAMFCYPQQINQFMNTSLTTPLSPQFDTQEWKKSHCRKINHALFQLPVTPRSHSKLIDKGAYYSQFYLCLCLLYIHIYCQTWNRSSVWFTYLLPLTFFSLYVGNVQWQENLQMYEFCVSMLRLTWVA